MAAREALFTLSPEQHGGGPVLYSWHPEGSYVASVGQSRVVQISDRYGNTHARIQPSPGTTSIDALEWDMDGEFLAVLQGSSGLVQMWDKNSQGKITVIDTGEKANTFLAWSKVGPELAIGSLKGNLYIYNRHTNKTVPIKGKHQKRITCGAWNRQNKLALGSEDKQVTISDKEGDNLETLSVKSPPSQLAFNEQKTDDGHGNEQRTETVTVNLANKNIYMCNLHDHENPIELAFMPKYGAISKYKWFGDGYIMLGFSSGYLNAVSTHMKEIGEEIFNMKLFSGEVTDMAISAENYWTAVAGDSTVFILNMREADFRAMPNKTITLPKGQTADQLHWTQDGNVLSVSTKQGSIYAYLVKVPCLCAGWDTRVAHLASLRELSVVETSGDAAPITIMVETEPGFIAIGPKAVACGMNNRVWFYSIETRELIHEQEYHGTVSQVALSADYAAVRVEGQVMLHPYDPTKQVKEGRDDKRFPDKREEKTVTHISMTNDFLVFATSRGYLHYFYLKQWADVNEFRHDSGIRSVFPNHLATRLAFIDDTHAAQLYNPVNDQLLAFPDFPSAITTILWDSADPGVLVACGGGQFFTYAYSAVGLNGPSIKKLEPVTELPDGYNPISVYNGEVTCQASTGGIEKIALETHSALLALSSATANPAMYHTVLSQNMALGRLKECWDVACALNAPETWRQLATAALEVLDLELALRIYRKMGDAAMVLALQRLLQEEDSKLVAGNVALLFGDYGSAQDFFLVSSRPQRALEMRRDLLHWDQSLKLARTLAPNQIPYISRAYAQQLEFKGEFALALSMYEKGVIDERQQAAAAMLATEDPQAGDGFENLSVTKHNELAHAGIARTVLRTGDVPRGVHMAAASGSSTLQRDCAAILEELKQWQDAAMLFEKAGALEKAAEIYINNKNYAQAAPLMASISTPKLHLAYAQAKEEEGQFVEAARAYEKAKDMDNVVRLNLEHMQNPQQAFAIVRETRSTVGAAMVASYCKKSGNVHAAVEFLLVAKEAEEAFTHATTHGAMDTYANSLGDDGTPDEYAKIARFFESTGELAKAGQFYRKCQDYSRAIALFLKCGDKEINAAIDVVGEARSEVLTNTLIDFLMGESDGVPKDPKFVFRLYMALGKYPEAVRTANIIAQQEQELGNYKPAHDLLFDTYKDLEAGQNRVPRELYSNLTLLHSYVLVKYLLKMGDHATAARMLLRVSKKISSFPAHVVPILTSTVVECMKAGLKKSALAHAQQLMLPEHRPLINATYKRKIETMVRKGSKGDPATDPDEPCSPCPNCGEQVPESELDCPACRFAIPFCIVSGKHVVAHDYTVCPSCRFDASFSLFSAFIREHKVCPMCDTEVVPSAIRRLGEDEAVAIMKRRSAYVD